MRMFEDVYEKCQQAPIFSLDPEWLEHEADAMLHVFRQHGERVDETRSPATARKASAFARASAVSPSSS